MTTIDFKGAYDGHIHYIGNPVFIYSPAPIIVDMPDAPEGYPYQVTVINTTTGQSYSETRRIHDGKAYFEISAILQHLMSVNVSEVFSSERGEGAYDPIHVEVTDIRDDSTYNLFFDAIYGALDQLESFSDSHTRADARPQRLWVNYPQTVRVQRDDHDEFFFVLPGNTIFLPGVDPGVTFYEIDLMQTLRNVEGFDVHAADALAELQAGHALTIGVSSNLSVSNEGRRYTVASPHYIRFIPDLAPADRGTYLRWLQRDGSFGYWWFETGELSVAAQEKGSFQQFHLGNPAEQELGQLHNSQKADFLETQTLSLGTYVNNQDEFDYLTGLATSPVVDRLVDRPNETWQRVNIVPGSHTRNRKWATPHRSAFDIAITLPQRNTIKL